MCIDLAANAFTWAHVHQQDCLQVAGIAFSHDLHDVQFCVKINLDAVLSIQGNECPCWAAAES